MGTLNCHTYALKIKLRWCIIGGIVRSKYGEPFRCNRTTVKDIITGKLSSHHFVKDPGCKIGDNGVEEAFWKIYHNISCEYLNLPARGIPGDMEEISKDYMIFLAIVEKGTKKADDMMKYSCFREMEFSSFSTIKTKPSKKCNS